jgi:hypothetical protein
MRERMQAAKPGKAALDRSAFAKPPQTKDLLVLLKRIEILEAENLFLRRRLSTLRDQPRAQERSPGMIDSEGRQLFMKYSNVRRY